MSWRIKEINYPEIGLNRQVSFVLYDTSTKEEKTIFGKIRQTYSGKYYIDITNYGNNYIFRELSIDDYHEYVKNIVGHEISPSDAWPEVQSLNDLSKVLERLKKDYDVKNTTEYKNLINIRHKKQIKFNFKL